MGTPEHTLRSRDELLLSKLKEAVLNNLQNEQFGVTELSNEVAISRFHLHRKLKALTGKSVSQFIRETRLEEAMKLLRADAATAAEISYRVGFSSPSYFNKCFHDFYGYSPGEVKKKISDNNVEPSVSAPVTVQQDVPVVPLKNKSLSKVWLIIPIAIGLLIASRLFFHLPKKQNEVSIAVLPLENLTGFTDQAYFVNGMHDALIGELGQISALRVISRTSTLRYPNREMLLQEIARELGVDAIVEGSVYGSGDSVRIQLQLIEAFPEERHVWAKEYHEDIRNVLAVQSTVVRDIAREIQVTLRPEEEKRLSEARLVNPETYKAYLQGMYHINQLEETEVEKGIMLLHDGLNIDPGDPLLWAALSIGYGTQNHGPSPTDPALVNSKAAARKALALDPTLAEAHLAIGMIALYNDWDWHVAEESLSKAIEFNPNLAEAHAHYAWLKMLLGEEDKILLHAKKATEIDPFSITYSSYLASEYWWLGDYDAAMKQIELALRLSPDNGFSLFVQGNLYASKGMFEEAISIHEKVFSQSSKQWRWPLGQTFGSLKREEDARKIIEEIKADPVPIDSWGLAEIYASLNDKDEAFRWLEEGAKTHFSWIPWMGWNPNYKSLHDDPRFEKMLHELKLPPLKQTASTH